MNEKLPQTSESSDISSQWNTLTPPEDSLADLESTDVSPDEDIHETPEQQNEHLPGISNYLDLLYNPKAFKQAGFEYANEYSTDASISTKAIILWDDANETFKEALLDNDPDFYASDEFQDIAQIIHDAAASRTIELDGETFFSGFANNTIMRSEVSRERLLRHLYSPEEADRHLENIEAENQKYERKVASIEAKFDHDKKLSQAELDFLADYIYSGRNFDDARADKFMAYIFNRIEKDEKLQTSVPIVSAITNYCVENFQGAEGVNLTTRFFVSDFDGTPGDLNDCIACRNGARCVIGREFCVGHPLACSESLEKRSKATDPYSIMHIAFHELEHVRQELGFRDGDSSRAAVSGALLNILRSNNRSCIYDGVELIDEGSYYDINHDADEAEIDADEEGWRQSAIVLSRLSKKYKPKSIARRKECSEKYKKCLKNMYGTHARRMFSRKFDEDGHLFANNEYNALTLSKNIAENPDILQEYPVFQKYFDDKGNVKVAFLFDNQLASSTEQGIEGRRDDFGIDLGSYIFSNPEEYDKLIDYILENPMKPVQTRCFEQNICNILYRDLMDVRCLDSVDFNFYNGTHTWHSGDQQSIKSEVLNGHLIKLYKCMTAAHIAKKQNPGNISFICDPTNYYLTTYFTRLRRSGCRLDDADACLAVTHLKEIKGNPSIQYIINEIKKDIKS